MNAVLTRYILENILLNINAQAFENTSDVLYREWTHHENSHRRGTDFFLKRKKCKFSRANTTFDDHVAFLLFYLICKFKVIIYTENKHINIIGNEGGVVDFAKTKVKISKN